MRFLALGPGEGWHADQLRAAAHAAGDTLDFADYESIATHDDATHDAYCGENRVSLADYDRLLTRTMPMGTLEQITFRLSALHVIARDSAKVVNSPRGLELAIDKYATTVRLHELHLRVPKTHVSQSRSEAMQAFQRLGGDVVVKPLFGGEGRGVMRVESPELAWTTFSTLEQLGAVIYQQAFVPPGGTDLRLLVVGENVWAIERSNPLDWRTNVARGSSSRLLPTSPENKDVAIAVCDAFGLRIAAIDLLYDETGGYVALEVNAVPGWKGAQRVVDENIAEHIIRTLRNG